MALDPVCGMTVDPGTAAGQHEHEGRTYYFCSQHCLHAFKADPATFLSGKKKPEQIHGAQYTCPMHPEIVRDGPADCPLCGMALVPIAGTGEADNRELHELAIK